LGSRRVFLSFIQ